MVKYYFGDDEGRCYTLDYFLEKLGGGCDEMTVYPAKMVTGQPFFHCTKLCEVMEVGERCGNQCGGYKPRNGKNGRCVHSNNCYEPMNDKPKILKL